MSKQHWIILALVLVVMDRYNRSHMGMSAIDTAEQTELANFAAFNGTNFTNSRRISSARLTRRAGRA